MNRRKITTVLVVLSMIYGSLVGLLAAIDSNAVTVVAIIGGAILGISWATAGYLSAQHKA